MKVKKLNLHDFLNIKCIASGNVSKITLRKGSVELESKSGSNTPLEIHYSKEFKKEDKGVYTCIAYGSNGGFKSQNVEFIICKLYCLYYLICVIN